MRLVSQPRTMSGSRSTIATSSGSHVSAQPRSARIVGAKLIAGSSEPIRIRSPTATVARDEPEVLELPKLVGKDRSGDMTWQPAGEVVEAQRPEQDELRQDGQAPSVTQVLDGLAERAVVVDVGRAHAAILASSATRIRFGLRTWRPGPRLAIVHAAMTRRLEASSPARQAGVHLRTERRRRWQGDDSDEHRSTRRAGWSDTRMKSARSMSGSSPTQRSGTDTSRPARAGASISSRRVRAHPSFSCTAAALPRCPIFPSWRISRV